MVDMAITTLFAVLAFGCLCAIVIWVIIVVPYVVRAIGEIGKEIEFIRWSKKEKGDKKP